MIRKIVILFLVLILFVSFGGAKGEEKYPVNPAFTIKPQFNSAMSFSEGLAVVGIGGKKGYIDHAGNIVIKPKFDLAWRFSEGLAPVNINGVWGFIDKSGKYKIKPKYGWALSFTEGLAVVNIGGLKEGKWGFIDKEGKVIIEPKFDIAWPFSNGVAEVKANGLYLHIDKSGKTVKIEWAERFPEGLYPVKYTKWGYLDKSGKIVIDPNFDMAFRFSKGIAVVVVDGKWGFINPSGDFVIEPGFAEIDFAHKFCEGLSRVGIDDDGDMDDYMDDMAIDRWGYIDKTGKLIIDIRYKKAYDFSEGVAAVMVDGKWGYIKNPLK